MSLASRFSALIAYLPILGWIYAGIFRNKDSYVLFHLRQSIGLGLFLVLVLAGWAVAAWAIAWIPYAFVLSVALFALVIVALLFAIVVWVVGMIHALQGRKTSLPLAGNMLKFISSFQS
jgi:uncharacterized membrane protein